MRCLHAQLDHSLKLSYDEESGGDPEAVLYAAFAATQALFKAGPRTRQGEGGGLGTPIGTPRGSGADAASVNGGDDATDAAAKTSERGGGGAGGVQLRGKRRSTDKLPAEVTPPASAASSTTATTSAVAPPPAASGPGGDSPGPASVQVPAASLAGSFKSSQSAASESALAALEVASEVESAEEAVRAAHIAARTSGACTLVAFLDERTLTVANAGDCRAILGRRGGKDAEDEDGDNDSIIAIPLSIDHKPDRPEEQARIEAAGGYVRPAVGQALDLDYMPSRLYADKGNQRLGPGLCMSRSLGDLDGIACGMTSAPELQTVELGERDHYLILASDGLWEFISEQEAVDQVARGHASGQSMDVICRKLILHAALQWRLHEGFYRDDITAIVVHLPSLFEHIEAEKARGPAGGRYTPSPPPFGAANGAEGDAPAAA